MAIHTNGIRKFLAIAATCLIPAVCSAQVRPQVSAADIYVRTHSSVVVVIVADQDSKPVGQGSGFIVAKDRIVTNHHVVEGASKALVVFADGASELVEGVVADSPSRDLAILAVETKSHSPLKLGDEMSVRRGDSVYALGAPRGLESSITNGIVSGFRNVDEQFMIQTTAIAPGSSGGPLFDSSGRVIGVTTSFFGDSPGIYFSVGVGDVKRLLRTPNLVSVPLAVWSKAESIGPKPATGEAAGEPNVSSSNEGSSKRGDSVQPPGVTLPLAKGLYVTSDPTGADVFINGAKQSGQTPVVLPLAPGEYNIVLRLGGYEPYSGSVHVKDERTHLNVELNKRPPKP